MKKLWTTTIILLSVCIILFGQLKIPFPYDENAQGRVVSGENIYHQSGCPLLKVRGIGMPLKSAISRGYKPCPECLPDFEQTIAVAKGQKPSISFKEEKPSTTYKPGSRRTSISAEGFRQVKWGMNEAAVKKTEQASFVEETKSSDGMKILAYSVTIGGLDALAGYYFAEGKFVAGRYMFINEQSNKTLYISDYNSINQSISEKYGAIKPYILWRNPLYKDDRPDWGLAISIGHLVYESTWELDDCNILHQLYGNNYQISHVVHYECTLPEYKALKEKAAKKAKEGIW